MGLRIGTNVASIHAQRLLTGAEKRTTHAFKALASGSRIVEPADDAAGWAISESLRGQAASLSSAKMNSENAKGLIQVAEGGLNEQNNIVVRLRELAVQAASDSVGDEEREFLNTEFVQLSEELDRIAATTSYGNKKLLIGTNEEFEFHLGTHNDEADVIKYTLDADTTATTLGIENLSISDRDEAGENLEALDEAIVKIAQVRSNFGAIQKRFEIASSNLDLQRENILAARARIADADIAHEVSEMMNGQIQQSFGVAVLAQANQMPERALRLLA